MSPSARRRLLLLICVSAVAFAFYVVAKILEALDWPIARLSGGLSGHTLKHLAAAAAVTCLLLAVPTRPAAASDGVRAAQ